jgi:hypothetical protein
MPLPPYDAVVVRAQRPAPADRGGLLPDARMKRAADLAALIQIADGFFKLADVEHLPEGGPFGFVHYLWEELSTAAIYHTHRLEGNALMVAEAQAGVAWHRWR